MQNIRSIDGGGIFSDGGSGDRRLRTHHHQHHPTNQALKCPRCDSPNTKFCYYNNYNLSQPRHFCKGCRRYWTKGGVLRNVPVGGGCRKTKRSRTKSSQPSESVPAPSVQTKSSPNSSSESSSLTATTTAAATEAVSASSSRSPSRFLNIQEFMNPSQGFDHEILQENPICGFFSGIGGFSSLITSSNDQLSFRFDNSLDPHNQWQQQQPEAVRSGTICSEKIQSEVQAAEEPYLEQDVKVEFSPAPSHPTCTSIFGPSSDWQPSYDQGLLDLPDATDHAYNWSQTNPWTDVDQPSYIP